MNKEIELLYNKLDAQDKIINEQALEIAKLKEQRYNLKEDFKRHIDRINELTERIDKVIEYIKNNTLYYENYDYNIEDELELKYVYDDKARKDLLEILEGKANE